MKGLILNNAYYSLPSYLYQAERMKEEFEKLGVEAEIRRNDFFPVFVGEGGELVSRVSEYDFCVYFDKDKYVSEMLEKLGMRVFNRHEAIRACDDKMVTAVKLAGSGVPMPKSMAGLLCYSEKETVSRSALDKVEAELGYPMIVKTSFGSLGKGVYKIDDRKSLEEAAEKLKLVPHFFQRFVGSGVGRDARVIVIGGKVVAAMERRNESDFRSNVELGGSCTPISPTPEMEKICLRAAKALDLDYCGVDVLFDGDDGLVVCEVNSNAFFGGAERATGVNVAKAFCKHVIAEMKKLPPRTENLEKQR